MADGFAQERIKDALKYMLNVTLGYLQRTLIMAQVDAAIPAPLIQIGQLNRNDFSVKMETA